MSAPPMATPMTSGYAPLPALQNDGGAREFLMQCKWPGPLQESFINNLARTPLRYFVCDDSGSMCTDDGKKLVTDARGNHRYV